MTNNNHIFSPEELFYINGTDPEIINIIDKAYANRTRLRIWYNTANIDGTQVCHPNFAESGYIGRSTGKIKTPILLKTRYSSGGHAINTNCIVGIQQGHNWVYRTNAFRRKLLRYFVQDSCVYYDPSVGFVTLDCIEIKEFNTPEEAERYKNFIIGKRLIR